MVGQCSRRPDVTSGRGGLMTDWCFSSITDSTLPTPVGQLNGSILSLSFSPTPFLSVCLGSREAPWEFNCLVFP